MGNQQQAALVFAGPVSRGSLNRLPGLKHQLRYVKSSSLATAGRAARALKWGVPVQSVEELRQADLLILSAPERQIPTISGELLEAVTDWVGVTVVLYDSRLDSAALEPFRRAGAHVASLTWHARPEQFMAEGDPAAIRRIRTLTGDKKLLLLRSKESYLRALRSATVDFYPVFASAVHDLREAGMEKAAAERTAASLIDHSARVFLRAGRRVLRGSGGD